MIKTLSMVLALSVSIFAQQNDVSWDIHTYLKQREAALEQNRLMGIDAKVTLTEKEEYVNKLLVKMRKNLYVLSAKNLLTEVSQKEKTQLFSMVKKMPKGSLLHVHSASLIKTEWLISELTTLPDCYVYWDENGPVPKGTLHFFAKDQVPPGYESVEKLRNESPEFDEILFSYLRIEKNMGLSPKRWKRFEGWFTKTAGLIHYKPAFIKYYTYAMQTLVEDNLQYMELRALNAPIYQLDGTVEDPIRCVETFLQIKQLVQKTYPDFDFKLIHTDFRHTPKDQALAKIETAYFLRSLYPDFILGYDLVGEEDTGRTTLDYIDELIEARAFEQKYGVDLPYYFHNGESNWAFNTNVFDAVLLQSKRIGHGLNLFHYPYLLSKIKEDDICLELCPISNRVLGYVSDIRIHPGASYIKSGIPCVISSDDPGLFGYHGLSADLWEAIVGWDLDLKNVKQLCMNSITYSGMSEEEKGRAFSLWSQKWNEFIDEYYEE